MSLLGVLQTIFIVLKLLGVISWAWGAVLIPLWIWLALVIILFIWNYIALGR